MGRHCLKYDASPLRRAGDLSWREDLEQTLNMLHIAIDRLLYTSSKYHNWVAFSSSVWTRDLHLLYLIRQWHLNGGAAKSLLTDPAAAAIIMPEAHGKQSITSATAAPWPRFSSRFLSLNGLPFSILTSMDLIK